MKEVVYIILASALLVGVLYLAARAVSIAYFRTRVEYESRKLPTGEKDNAEGRSRPRV